MSVAVPFGPTGEVVYKRTYSRTFDGSKEEWPDTVDRVVKGNLALVYGPQSDWKPEVWDEYGRLYHYLREMALLPAGRHLWATGVPGRQYLFNCHVAGWGGRLSDHFEFSFLRLMEGGGVGANYSSKHIAKFGAPQSSLGVKIICHPDHPDYEELRPYLSDDPDLHTAPDWKYDGETPYRVSAGVMYSDGLEVGDSREGWAEALVTRIDASFSEGAGYHVYDVSGVRWSGAELKTFGGTASGPAPFAAMMIEVSNILNRAAERRVLTPIDVMEMDHAIAECVVSGGNRRSARMSIVHWDDPYITDFLKCKTDTGKHWTTNISVEIDDRFMAELSKKCDPNLCQDMKAVIVHGLVVDGMLKNGEPGYWNSSLSAKGEVGEVIATNPCGEIALEAWENCNLGHVNMDWFAGKKIGELLEAHKLMTRFLMRATFGDINDPKQKTMLDRNRRIGVGHLGVQGYWAKQGYKYSDIPGIAPRQLQSLYQTVRKEAREYAFELRIPEPVKVTAIAPTGSVAKLPGVSEGIHPIYARHFERRIRFSKRDDAQFQTVMEAMNKGFTVEDDVYDQSGMTAVVVYPTEDILLSQVRALGIADDVVQSADELSIENMLMVQRCYQTYYADNAVSYTVNIPEGSATPKQLAYVLARFLPELKGTTVMVDASRPQSPYTRITKAEYEAAVATVQEDSIDESCASGACPVR